MVNNHRRRVTFQPAAYRGLQRGVNLLVDAIRPTLGPLPRMVANDTLRANKVPEFLDNGGDIARRIINLPDREADSGAMFVRDFLWRLQNHVGDGTATAAVIFQSVYNQSLRFLGNGGNPQMLRNYLEKGMHLVLERLKEKTIHIEGREKLAQIAETVCFDPYMAKLLGEIYDIVGEFGRVEIRPGRSRDLEREYIEGMYWERGLMAREPLYGSNEPRLDMESPAILISDLEIEDTELLFPPLEMVLRAGIKSLIIVANKISDKAVGFLQANKNPERLTVALVYTPGYGKEEQRWALEDLAVLTGGRPFIQAAGETFKKIKVEDLGHSRRAWAERQSFGIIGGKGDARTLRQHLARLRDIYAKSENAVLRGKIHQRISKLMGGSATLWVGGITEKEIEARKALAERAAATVRAAMMGGVVPGGGAALFMCRDELLGLAKQTQDIEERAAYRVLANALAEPLATLTRNAGHSADEIMAIIRLTGSGNAFDVRKEQVVDAVQAGLFDPAEVVRMAFYTAVASAIHLLSVDVLVHPKNPERAVLPDPGSVKQI